MGIGQFLRKKWVWLKGGDSNSQEPDWAIILSTLYRTEPPDESDDLINTQPRFDRDLLIDSSGLRNSQVILATRKLENWGLLEIERVEEDDSAFYSLTKEGFEVAHERELSNKSNRINQSLVFFTSVLVLTEIAGIMPAPEMGRLFIILLILIAMFVVVRQTDALN